MKKFITITLIALVSSLASFALTPITGTFHGCVGSTNYLHDTTGGGTWSSSSTGVAYVDSMGAVTGASAGVATITYTVGSSYVTASYTVNPTPAAITGTTSICVGATSTLADAVSGGTWSSYDPTIASVGTSTGVLTGVASGTTTIYYSLGACAATTTVSIGYVHVDSILGPSAVCEGSTVTLTNATSGGTWTSANPAIASVGASTGIVTGVAAGYTTITYSVTSSCGTGTVFQYITVSGATSAGTISGASSTYVGSSIALYSTVSGGTWSSSSTSIATVGASSGMVTGVAVGSATITYSVTGCTGTVTATAPVTVVAADRISGNVNFSGAGIDSMDVVKVWLITYNTTSHMLEAIDSVSATVGGGATRFYEFLGPATDSYRVKAAVYPASFSSTGYIPTYHTSSFYWNAASVLHHTSGTVDMGVDINMAYGSTTSGPGFIAGDVTTGANRGSTGGVAVGLLIMAIDATTGNLVKQAYTDATGHYSFSGLPLGTYRIYPEAINYATTPANVTLTSSASSVTTTRFVQHTVSKTITPGTAAVNNINSATSVTMFPNPSSGKLNITWSNHAAGNAEVTIMDVAGRNVYSSSINMNATNGQAQLELNTLKNGTYQVTIKSNELFYTDKLTIQH